MPAQSLVLTGTSSPAIVAGGNASGSPIHGYIYVRLKPLTGTCYLGDSGVTTAGYPLSTADTPLEVNLSQTETLWLASSSGGAPTVAVLRVGETT